MKIAIIEGGPSTEAEVSRASATSLALALKESGHETHQLELCAQLSQKLLQLAPDVVFPAAHGTQGEDGCVQGLLEVLRLPYVGSDVRASAMAADKACSKVFFRAAGLRVARERILTRKDQGTPCSQLLSTLRAKLSKNLILKPVQGGSTIGISRILSSATPDNFAQALSLALQYDAQVLVEEYIEGREITCGVIDEGSGPRALAATLIIAEASDWYDFESKYAQGGSKHICPAPLSAPLLKKIQEMSVLAHEVLGARDLSRADFIIDENDEPYLLEVNTLPGMTKTSLFPEAARVSGLPFAQWTNQLVVIAQKRAPGRGAQGVALPS